MVKLFSVCIMAIAPFPIALTTSIIESTKLDFVTTIPPH